MCQREARTLATLIETGSSAFLAGAAALSEARVFARAPLRAPEVRTRPNQYGFFSLFIGELFWGRTNLEFSFDLLLFHAIEDRHVPCTLTREPKEERLPTHRSRDRGCMTIRTSIREHDTRTTMFRHRRLARSARALERVAWARPSALLAPRVARTLQTQPGLQWQRTDYCVKHINRAHSPMSPSLRGEKVRKSTVSKVPRRRVSPSRKLTPKWTRHESLDAWHSLMKSHINRQTDTPTTRGVWRVQCLSSAT